jgi:hypothetical protein
LLAAAAAPTNAVAAAATPPPAPVTLTPKPAATPRINGPKIFGVRPGTAREWQTWRRDLKEFAPLLFQK